MMLHERQHVRGMRTSGHSRPMTQAPRQALAAGNLEKDASMIPRVTTKFSLLRRRVRRRGTRRLIRLLAIGGVA